MGVGIGAGVSVEWGVREGIGVRVDALTFNLISWQNCWYRCLGQCVVKCSGRYWGPGIGAWVSVQLSVREGIRVGVGIGAGVSVRKCIWKTRFTTHTRNALSPSGGCSVRLLSYHSRAPVTGFVGGSQQRETQEQKHKVRPGRSGGTLTASLWVRGTYGSY